MIRHEVPVWVTVEWEVFRAMMRARRQALGLRQSDVAEAMGRSKDFVSNLENGVHTPGIGLVMQWVAALGGTVAAHFPDG